MDLIPVKTPRLVKSLFPNYVWNIPTDEKVLYLTFDDGPTPEVTPWVLQQLKAYNVKATFFCIGSNIEKHPEIFTQILEDRHSIGNHTYNHLKGWKVKTKTYLDDIEKARQIINSNLQNPNSKAWNEQKWNLVAKNSGSELFRPPYGKLKPKQGRRLLKKGYSIIMWDVLSFDWDKSVSKEHCLDNVIYNSKEGSIVVFHDSVKAKQNLYYVLPKMLEYYKKKGFEFKAI